MVASVVAIAVLTSPSPSPAFDTGPHADLTRDAMTSEGFNAASAGIGVVNNWFVDYYTNPDKNPYSGHAGALIGVTRLGLARETWPDSWVEGARRLHFDAEKRQVEMPNLSTIAGIEQEWQRIMYITQRRLRYAGQKEDPVRLLAVIGTSIHTVQDFYSHSNWVEDRNATDGRGGPGVSSLGYGDTPTWFDVPHDVRKTLVGNRAVYTGVKTIPRGHGNWRTNNNTSLFDGLNKDWPGRSKYQEAYITAYFASRQWLRAMRTWLGNEPLWKRAMAMPNTSALQHDLRGAEDISEHSGHWQGGGEPCVPFSCGERTGKAGSVASLRLALGEFHDRGPTVYRRAFNEIISEWGRYPAELPSLPDLPSSRTDQVLARFVKLEVLDYRGIELGDLVGDADIYARARIDGQPYASTIINGEDSFRFPGVYAPFTWIRSVPTPHAASAPVTSMTVRVETGDRRYAGTDDDVFLRLSPTLRLPLEKRAYNDFERGDDDTYSVPVGAATRDGLKVGDIDRVMIEKSKDGVAGGWFLHGVTLTVNGRALVRERGIDRWLEKSNRLWTAPRFTRDATTDDVVGVWLQLLDDDFGANDTGDINSYDRHTSLPVAYRLGTTVQRHVVGGSWLRGRLPLQDGDRAALTYRLTSFAVTPPPPPGSPPANPPPPPPPTNPPPPPAPTDPPPGPKPDLIITYFASNQVTVKNQGAGAAGPFTVTVTGRGTARFADGLAPGQQLTKDYPNPNMCDSNPYHAQADSGQEVAESDETNNTRDGLDHGLFC